MKIYKYVTVLLAVAAMSSTFMSCDRDNDITGDPMADHNKEVNGKQDYWIDFALSNPGTLSEDAKTLFTQKIVEVIYPEDWANGVREIKFIEHPMYNTQDYVLNNFNAVVALPNSESDIVQKIMLPVARLGQTKSFDVTMTLSKDSMRTAITSHVFRGDDVLANESITPND
jgi:hypothetical protein